MKAELECGVPDERKREGPKRTQVLRTVYVRRVVERAGVINSLTVRNLASSGAEGDCRNGAVHAAAFSHLCHVEPSSGWFGHRLGEETARCLGCLRRLPPEGGVPGSREETAPCLAVRAREAGARAGLVSAGGSADAPACGQAVGANLARTNLDLGRARWMLGSSKRMNGIAKGLRACFKISRGPVFGQKAGWQARRGRRCARPPRSNSEGIREQGEARWPFARKPSGRRVFCPWPALARSSQPAAGRCAPPKPPWPRPKSLAAAPLVVSKQALMAGGHHEGLFEGADAFAHFFHGGGAQRAHALIYSDFGNLHGAAARN